MRTKQLLSSLCAAVYPLVSIAAALSAALCISTAGDQEAAITPQAMRAPELPVGCVV